MDDALRQEKKEEAPLQHQRLGDEHGQISRW